jgi:hypothetical protein
MVELFESYELTAEDKAQLRRDIHDHPRTSHASLKEYAKALRSAGTVISKDEVQEALTWLNMHQSELPPELENDAGQSGGRGLVISTDAGDTYTLEDNATKYEEHGLFYVDRANCYESIDDILKSTMKGEELAILRAQGPRAWESLRVGLDIRGERYRLYRQRQDEALRWRGMEEWDAVAKADEQLRKGAKLTPAAASANELPPVERLRELLTIDNGNLVWAVARRGVAKGKAVTNERVGIDGEVYYTNRIMYKLMHGVDPESAGVSDDLTLKDYRSVGVSTERTREDSSNKFDAQVQVNSNRITVGTYSTEEQADAACSIFIRALEWGL